MNNLHRSSTDKVIAGVLGGFSSYFRIDSTLLRIAFVIIVLFTGFFPGVFAYIIAALVIPKTAAE